MTKELVKVGTPKEALWAQLKKQNEERLLQMEIEKELLESNLSLAKKGIKKEQDA